jgi:phage/plasmid-associated DNA primase
MTSSEFIDPVKKQTDSKLYKFLTQYRVTDIDGNKLGNDAKSKARQLNSEKEIMITTVLPFGGKYYVPKKQIDKMCDTIYSDIQNRSTFYATEKPDKLSSPFRVDIDLKTIIRANTESGLDLKSIYIKIYDYFANFISKSFKIEQEALICYVLTKRDIRRKDQGDEVQQLVGVHLHFPYARATADQIKKIRENVSYIATSENVFPSGFLAEKFVDSIEATVWTLYGSVKDNMAYRVSHVLSRKVGKATKIQNFSIIGDTVDTVKLLLLTNYANIPNLVPNEAFQKTMDEEIENAKIKMSQWKKDMKSGEFNQIELEKANQLCFMLNPKRFDKREDWRNLGLVLHSISKGHEEGFKLWEIISEKMNPEQFSESDCATQMKNIWAWASASESSPWNMGSLIFWAQTDNPKDFNDWRRNANRSLTEMAIKVFNEGALADLAFELYGKEFQFTTNSNWFKFFSEYGHWDKDPYKHPKWIKSVFMRELKNYLKEYIKAEEHLADCMKNLTKLGTNSLLNNCVAMAQNNFSTDRKFEEQLDQNTYLIGDQNGVYDLINGVHRRGTPEDYVSMKMGAHYRDYTWDHPDVKSVMRFWAKIHVDPELRRYFLKAISVCMVAGNKEKMILVMTNDNGDAGKSACLKIIERVWGDYAVTLSRERFVVSSFKTAGGPSPDIANARNKRLGSVKELSKDETLDIGAIKLFSGSDDVQVRTLYDKGGDMQVLLTLILMMNKLPPIPPGDKPTWNRMRVIPFESIFDDEAPNDEREQWRTKHFKPDRDIKGKLAKLKDAFYWVFLQYFKIYQLEGLSPLPAKIKAATQSYRESSDIFEQFLTSSLIETLDPKDFVKVTEDYYSEYLEWFNLNTRGKKMVPPKFYDFKKSVITYFSSKKTKIGDSAKGPKYFKYIPNPAIQIPAIHGMRLRGAEDDINDDIAENQYEDVEDAKFYGEDINLTEDKMDENDFNEYFVGQTFIGMDDETSNKN